MSSPKLRLRSAAFSATALSTLGVLSVWSTAAYLLSLWYTDPLKSIGSLIPVVSLLLLLRVWHALGWELEGSWWGLVILLGTIALVHLRDHAILEFVLSPSWAIFLPPHSLVAVAYVAGCVLLFGGMRLLRAGWFPVLLMWFVNPVPNFFTLHIDLPMQHASAKIARAFAHLLGQQLTTDQLRLMFTPEFGMFIAPGCNGIRGAITMGFIALVAGYLYRFRTRVWVLTVLGAVLLGYVFNLVRLCVLVLYYLVALRITWLQNHAEMGDYIIGAALFFVATALLFTMIRRWSPTHDLRPPALPAQAGATPPEALPASFRPRFAAAFALLALGSFGYARGMVEARLHPPAPIDPAVLGKFPQTVGHFHLQREWNEKLLDGPVIFYWADYVSDAPAPEVAGHSGAGQDGPPVVSVGISPVLGTHDTLLCHAARGEDWLWHGDLAFPTPSGDVNFSGSFFNGGATQYLEATTICSGGSCGQFTSNRRHFGFIYSRPDTQQLLTESPSRPIPVLLRTETLDTAMAADAARAELVGNLHEFLAAARLSDFTNPYREP